MTTARKQLVSVDATPYYHCVSRCVRRCFLCGTDPDTGQSYEHRRDWVEQKIYILSQLYCIDICAYAIMSNHYHLVIHINRDKAMSLSHIEVVERWQTLHKLPELVKNWLCGQCSGQAEEIAALNIIELWRSRLWSLSWFMKELNYDISCRANSEDNCKGHFWESRFKSQALLDDQALSAAMAYVDLNPLRAGLADKPETSNHTSIQARLNALNKQLETAPCLLPFVGNSVKDNVHGIPFRLLDYIELIDWTARLLLDGKASMSLSCPPILERLKIRRTKWMEACTQLENPRASAIAFSSDIQIAKQHLNKTRIQLYHLNT